LGIIDYLKYGHDTNRNAIKEGWTLYDTYATRYRAEVYAKMLDRSGKQVLITESSRGAKGNADPFKVWIKD
jgi:hypothetical protein